MIYSVLSADAFSLYVFWSSPIRLVAIRRLTVPRRDSALTTPLARAAITRRSIPVVHTAIASAHCWTLRTAHVHAIYAAQASLKFVNDGCELCLQCCYALFYDLIGLETADCLNVVEESSRLGVVVERVIFTRWTTVVVDVLFILGPEASC